MHWIKAIFQPGHSFRSLMVTKQCWEIWDHLTWICIEFIYVIGKKSNVSMLPIKQGCQVSAAKPARKLFTFDGQTNF